MLVGPAVAPAIAAKLTEIGQTTWLSPLEAWEWGVDRLKRFGVAGVLGEVSHG